LRDKFEAAAGEYKTCRLLIRDFLLARIEVVSCQAAVLSLWQRYGLCRNLRAHFGSSSTA